MCESFSKTRYKKLYLKSNFSLQRESVSESGEFMLGSKITDPRFMSQ